MCMLIAESRISIQTPMRAQNSVSCIAVLYPSVLFSAFVFKVVSAQNITNDSECQVAGDPDVLGLGVRLGFYFQLSSNLVLGTIRPEDAANAFLPNVFFVISLVCAAIYSSAKQNFPPGSIIACTWYPVLAYVALIPFLFRRLPGNLFPQVMLCAGVIMATSCFAVWFWYRGLDEVHPDQCMEPRVFLVVNCSALGNIRTVFKVATPLLVVLSIVSAWTIKCFQYVYLSASLPDFITVGGRPRVFLLGLIWLSVGIVASELQLKWNHIIGTNSVDTTGQIIPLALGVLSLVQTFVAFKDVIYAVSVALVKHVAEFINSLTK
jgi:hypothetical protein